MVIKRENAEEEEEESDRVAGNVKWKRFQPFREPQARIVASHSYITSVYIIHLACK